MEAGLTIDLGSLAQWLSGGAGVIALVVGILANFRSARKTELDLVHTRISSLKTTVTDHGERMARVETVLEHMPTKEMVGDLATRMAEMSGDVREGNAHFEGLRDRINGIATAVEQLVENEYRQSRESNP